MTINALYFTKSGDGAGGGCEQVEVWWDRSRDDRVRLAFIEDVIDGYGEIWRAAAWQAAVVAADLHGDDLTGRRLFFQRSGRVDGPSAGGITTIGLLAALRGDAVRSDVAMTGTINPDGTIGPVGGVAHKIDGAAEAGMKRVLIPYGMRTDRDANLGREVDLIDRGERKGVEVIPVGDIYRAYKLATGEDLPRADPAPAPILANRAYQKVRVFAEEWLVKYEERLAEYRQVPSRFRSDFTDESIDDAKKLVDGVPRLLREGQAPLAYDHAFQAAFLVASANQIARTIWVDEKRGRKAAREYAKLFAQVPRQRNLALKKLRAERAETLGETTAQLSAYMQFVEALCSELIAELIIDGKIKLPPPEGVTSKSEAELEQILTGIDYLQVAADNYVAAGQSLDFADEVEGIPLPDNAPLEEVALFFRLAAQANLNQFEKAIVDSRAESSGVRFSAMRDAVLLEDEDYLYAWTSCGPITRRLLDLFDTEELPMVVLGQAIYSYSQSAAIMQTHYSLGTVYDDETDLLIGVRREAALKYMLDFAEEQTRRNIQRLRDAGVDPADTVFGYQYGSAMRTGDTSDKLYALEAFLESNLIARVTAYLGGFASLDAPLPQPNPAKSSPNAERPRSPAPEPDRPRASTRRTPDRDDSTPRPAKPLRGRTPAGTQGK